VPLEGAKPLGETTLVGGFEANDDVIGRPADVLVMPDGALLVADQFGGAVYRVSYSASAAPAKP
jgi:glucose/arabinose dehydrogenase